MRRQMYKSGEHNAVVEADRIPRSVSELSILELLKGGERTTEQVRAHLGMMITDSVYGILRDLRLRGLVRARKVRKKTATTVGVKYMPVALWSLK